MYQKKRCIVSWKWELYYRSVDSESSRDHIALKVPLLLNNQLNKLKMIAQLRNLHKEMGNR